MVGGGSVDLESNFLKAKSLLIIRSPAISFLILFDKSDKICPWAHTHAIGLSAYYVPGLCLLILFL